MTYQIYHAVTDRSRGWIVFDRILIQERDWFANGLHVA